MVFGPEYGQEWSVGNIQVQVTCSRLALMIPMIAGHNALRSPAFIVWDWKTGVKYVVSNRQAYWYGH